MSTYTSPPPRERDDFHASQKGMMPSPSADRDDVGNPPNDADEEVVYSEEEIG